MTLQKIWYAEEHHGNLTQYNFNNCFSFDIEILILTYRAVMEQRRRETIGELVRAGQSAKDIISLTGYPKSTVYRTIATVGAEGMSLDVLTHLAVTENGHQHS